MFCKFLLYTNDGFLHFLWYVALYSVHSNYTCQIIYFKTYVTQLYSWDRRGIIPY